jgi:hypothetical protein
VYYAEIVCTNMRLLEISADEAFANLTQMFISMGVKNGPVPDNEQNDLIPINPTTNHFVHHYFNRRVDIIPLTLQLFHTHETYEIEGSANSLPATCLQKSE